MLKKYHQPIIKLVLKIGSTFPVFELLDDNDNTFSLDKDFKNRYMVIYFYPKDDTPGCTRQACYFRDFNLDFKDLDCDIVGISSDKVESHKNFKLKYNLPFKLLSDKSGLLRKKLKLPNDFFGLSESRITFIINAKHEILFIFRSSLNMKSHITSAINYLKKNVAQ